MARVSELVNLGIPFEQAKLLGEDIGVSLTAAGTTIADALALVNTINVLGTVGSNTGAQLPDKPLGKEIKVENRGANALKLYPHSTTGTLNGGSAGASVAVAANELAICTRLTSTDWSVRIAVAP